MKWLWNIWMRKKTKNFTAIPLFTMIFDYQKYKENGEKGSCIWYALHPDISQDEFLREKMQGCVDHIRETYDMELFTRI